MKRYSLLAVSMFAVLALLATPVAAHAQTRSKGQPSAAQSQAKPKTALLDINSAAKAELMALPGIGDAYSQKIIDGRPYARKDQLVSKNIIPKATYDKIKDQIIATQAKK
jgi:competence protein ComEA